MNMRKATFDDVEEILKIINFYAGQGLMLARSRNMIYESLRDFVVAEEDGKILGVGGLHLIWLGLAEIRSLAVLPGLTKSGIGREIVETLEKEAREFKVNTIFALTYQPVFFGKLGYLEKPKEDLSPKVWKDCINCPKFPNCDEIAVVKEI